MGTVENQQGQRYCNRCGFIERGANHSLGGCRCSVPDFAPRLLLAADDRRRLKEIAGELEHLPAEIRRHLDQDGRDARFLRLLAERKA